MRLRVSTTLLHDMAAYADTATNPSGEVRRLVLDGGHSITYEVVDDGMYGKFFDVKFGDDSDEYVNGTITILQNEARVKNPDPMKKF